MISNSPDVTGQPVARIQAETPYRRFLSDFASTFIFFVVFFRDFRWLHLVDESVLHEPVYRFNDLLSECVPMMSR